MITTAAPPMPLTVGSPDQFHTLRTALQELDFTEESICRRLGIETVFEFKTLRENRQAGIDIRDALDVLIRLVMDGETLGEEHTGMLPAGLLANMEELGVVIRAAGQPARRYCPVVLYPVAGLYAVSDRNFPPDGAACALPADVVYPAITANTSRFLSILPDEPCEAFLDLCAGTGIAAMVAAARYARHAWACDLGQRSVHFCDFNRRLNGLDNVTAAQGDLYDAAGDLTFDRIAAHPPYVPNKDREFLFRDGGEDGEQILGRIVAGLPRYLRPGGRFYCLTLATDREGETLEQRIRRWLGPGESEFDVFVVATEFRRRPEKYIEAVMSAKGRLGELGDKAKLYERLKVTGVFYGTLVVQRRTVAGTPVTSRGYKAPQATGDAVEWFRQWETAASGPGFFAQLMDCRLRLAKHSSLLVTHTPRDGQLVPTKFEVRAAYPLLAEAPAEPWVAVLIGACDGKTTVRQLFSSLRDQEVIAPAMTEDEFAAVLKLLISNGFLEHERFPLPDPSNSERTPRHLEE